MGYFDRFSMGKYRGKTPAGKIWYFIWHEDSIESWIINIILAFLLIKYLVYPSLGLLLGTEYPIVAVVSNSMHHNSGFDEYWENAHPWYDKQGISKDDFMNFPMRNGFNRGDIMILVGIDIGDISIGDIIVFQSNRPDPIIHRTVAKKEGEAYSIQTKGDNYLTNPDSIITPLLNEVDIRKDQIIGKAFIRVPYLGYVKIFAVDLACMFNDYGFCIDKMRVV